MKSAVVRNNVFIECKLAMHLNYKGSSNQTVAPVGVTISDNTAIANHRRRMWLNMKRLQ